MLGIEMKGGDYGKPLVILDPSGRPRVIPDPSGSKETDPSGSKEPGRRGDYPWKRSRKAIAGSGRGPTSPGTTGKTLLGE